MRNPRLIGTWLACAALALFAGIAPAHGGARTDLPISWLIFVDDLHMNFADTGLIRRLLTSIAVDLIQDGDSAAIKSDGPSSISTPVTSDRRLLAEAIAKVSGAALKPTEVAGAGPGDELELRASVAGAAVTAMIDAAPRTSGRRTVMLYLSNGYPVKPLDERIARLADLAQRAGVIVFTLNTAALPREASGRPLAADPVLWERYRDTMLDSLRAIADPTGGFAVLSDRDFADSLTRIGRAVR